MPIRQAGVIEIVSRIMRNSQPFHHAPRPYIGGYGERDNLGQLKLCKPELKCRPRAFRGITAPPVLRGQPPADLDARREMRLEWRQAQTDEACERRYTGDLDCPLGIPVPVEVSQNSLDPAIALFSRKNRGKMLHDARVGVHRGERRPVRVAPAAQDQPLGS